MASAKKIEDFSIITLCAFRYALGRMTYITSIVPEFIKKNINDILTKDIERMITEIDEYGQFENGLGMECDKKSWLDLRAFLVKELEKRNG